MCGDESFFTMKNEIRVYHFANLLLFGEFVDGAGV